MIAHQDTLFCGPLMPKVVDFIAPRQGRAECVPSVGDSPLTHSRQYFENCWIQGDVDFIFGPYRCWFERCTLFMNERGGFYTAANTNPAQPFGFVFSRCLLTGACEPGQGYLGRPWRKGCATVFLECEMDEHVAPEGFIDWDEERVVTARCGEWRTSGARADQSPRHPSQKRLTDEEAAKVTLQFSYFCQ
jgi:pectinesterase